MIDKYLTEYSVYKATSSHRRDKGITKRLLAHFGDPLLKDITPSAITGYKSFRKQEGACPATIERELSLLKRAFNLAVREWEWCRDNPVSRVSQERFNNQVERWLSPEEESKLLDASPLWLRDILTFALNTGMRQGEILNLEWSCVDLSRKTVTIMRSKNGERRTIPINRPVLDILRSKAKVRHMKSSHVFTSQKATRIDQANLLKAFYRALKEARIENFRFHDLRHTFATRLVQAGVDLYKVAKLLGHKDIRMTQRYSHHYPESLRDGVEALEKFITILSQSRERESTQVCVTP